MEQGSNLILEYIAQEYQSNQRFEPVHYVARRKNESFSLGRKVSELKEETLIDYNNEFEPKYQLVAVAYTGVCSTDLNRHFLPFVLPQVTGNLHKLHIFNIRSRNSRLYEHQRT